MPPIGTLSSGATGAGRTSGSGGAGGTRGSAGSDDDAPLPPIPPRPPNYRPPSGGTALPSQPHTTAGASTNTSASLPNGAPSSPPAPMPIETPGRSAAEALPRAADGDVAAGDGVAVRSEGPSTAGVDIAGTQTEPPTAPGAVDGPVDAGTVTEGSPQTWSAETSQRNPEAPWTATGETGDPAFHATQPPTGDAAATEAQPKAEAPAPPEKQDSKERPRSALEHLAVLHAVKDLADSGHADVEPPPPPGKGE